MVQGFVRGLAGSARSGWRAARGWSGWRNRRGWALLAVGVLMAGILPVILVASDDSAPPVVVHLPRPLAIGAQPAPAVGPTDGPTAGPGPSATGRSGTVTVKQPPAAPQGTGRPEYSSTSVVVSLRDPATRSRSHRVGRPSSARSPAPGSSGSARRATRPSWWRRCSRTTGSWRRRWTSGGGPPPCPTTSSTRHISDLPEPDPDASRPGIGSPTPVPRSSRSWTPGWTSLIPTWWAGRRSRVQRRSPGLGDHR